MKIISLESVIHGFSTALKRFPFVMLMATMASVAGITFAEISFKDDEVNNYVINLMFTGFLGIPFVLSIALLGERLKLQLGSRIAIKVAAVILIIVYTFLLPQNFPDGPLEDVIQFMLFVLGAHLLVSFVAFLNDSGVEYFWQFNKTLLLRFILSGLYSAVLFAGLSVALVAIDNLLGITIEEVRYLQLFLLIAGIFNTGFFLSAVPEIDEQQTQIEAYPKPLKVFVQYLLLPLVTVYILNSK